MHGWICESTGGPEALVWREVSDPQPAADEVRIAVKCASLNFPDLLITQGKYQFKPPYPFVPGAEFSGYIDAVGEAVKHLRPGMPVAAIAGTGGFGSLACVKASQVLPLPAEFDLIDAAAFAFTYGTSHHALIDRGALKPGETVLVLGAAGGVGSAAIHIAKAAGAKVIAAASTQAKCEVCLAQGADAAFNYEQEDLREAIKRLTDGKGPDLIYDPVGGALAEPAFRSLAWRGRYLVVGFAGGGIPALPLNLPLLKGASLVGVFWGDFLKREPKAGQAALLELVHGYGKGVYKPLIDQVMPISDLPRAFERMASRQVVGKLVMRHGD